MSFDWRWICCATCWDPSFQVKLGLMPNRHFPEGAPAGRLVDPCWQLECRSGRNSKTHLGSSDDAFYHSRLNSRCVQGRSGFGRQCTSSPLRFQGEGRPPARVGGSRRDPIAVESFGGSIRVRHRLRLRRRERQHHGEHDCEHEVAPAPEEHASGGLGHAQP